MAGSNSVYCVGPFVRSVRLSEFLLEMLVQPRFVGFQSLTTAAATKVRQNHLPAFPTVRTCGNVANTTEAFEMPADSR